MTDWANAQYEALVHTDKDEDGYYRVDVLVDGKWAKAQFSEDVNDAVQKARDWVKWRRATKSTTETFPL